MSAWADLIALAAAMTASFYFSGIETGIYALNRVRLRLRVEEGDEGARRVADLVRRPQRTIVTILIGNHTANYLATFFCMAFLGRMLHVHDPEAANILILTPILFILGEIVPKDTFRMRAETLVYRWSRPLAVAHVVLWPVAWALRWLGRVSRALPRSGSAADAMLSRDRLKDLIHEVAEDGVLTQEQRRMVRNVMRVSSIPVRDAMVPLSEVDSVPAGFTREELVAVSAREGHTRVPVRGEDPARLEGVVSVLDLAFRPEEAPEDLVREAPAIPEFETVERALHTLRSGRHSMGFVAGSDGRTLGIVTVKDLVEEVSGELPAF